MSKLSSVNGELSTSVDYFKQLNRVIFKSEPLPPKSFLLELDENTQGGQGTVIYDILINIFLNGITTLFGNTVNPANITKEQFDLVNKYMHSTGYNTKLELDLENNRVNISFELL